MSSKRAAQAASPSKSLKRQMKLTAMIPSAEEPSPKQLKDSDQSKQTQVSNSTSSFGQLLHSSWRSHLSKELSASYFENLESFVQKKRAAGPVFPPADEVFSWSHYCHLDNVNVVILGQDPYHDFGQAHGLCFSVKRGVALPPSLKNIFKELKTEYPDFVPPTSGDLSGWAKQGVLLLNAVLTVDAHKANSHKDQGWEKFTDSVIRIVSRRCSNVVYLLWGAPAQKKASCVDTSSNLVLKCAHPSPLSAMRGFFGCDHFKKCNQYLLKNGKQPVDWKKL